MSGGGCYGILEPTFWTRGSGKLLRGKPVAQVVCLYLFSAPTSNMLGLYYLPISTICHDAGLTQKQVTTALKQIEDAKIASYDHDTETVFVYSMAARRLQLKGTIKAEDSRLKYIHRFLGQLPETPLRKLFDEQYGLTLRLPNWGGAPAQADAVPTPPPGPLDPPSTPPRPPVDGDRDQDQDQDQDQHQEQQQQQEHFGACGGPSSDEQGQQGASSTPPPAPSKTKKPRAPRKVVEKTETAPEKIPGYKEVVAVWFEEFERAKGTKPPFDQREGKFVKTLFEKLQDPEKIKNVIRAAFEQRWWVQHKCSLRDLSDNPNPFLGQRPGETTPELPFGRPGPAAPRVQRGCDYEPKPDPASVASLARPNPTGAF